MRRLRLTPSVDLDVYLRADRERYAGRPELLAQITPARFREAYGDCPSIGFEMDGQPIGGMLLTGNEVHIAVLASAHGQWALLLKPALRWLFGIRPAMVAHVEATNHASIAFMTRQGWRVLYADEQWIRYLLVPQGGTRKTEHRRQSRHTPHARTGMHEAPPVAG